MSRNLIYKTLPFYEGVDNTIEVEMPDYISWEIKYHCDTCGNEILEDDVPDHKCSEEHRT